MNARDAIALSTKRTTIVTIKADAADELHLRAACDDFAQDDDGQDFWGTADDGAEWRVRMTNQGES